jgi:hypothetical protein
MHARDASHRRTLPGAPLALTLAVIASFGLPSCSGAAPPFEAMAGGSDRIVTITLSSLAGACAIAQSDVAPVRSFDLVEIRLLSFGGHVVEPGVYKIPTGGQVCDGGVCTDSPVTAEAVYYGVRPPPGDWPMQTECRIANIEYARGSVTLTTVAPEHVAGSYDLTFDGRAPGPYGGWPYTSRVQGAFDVPWCPGNFPRYACR